MLINEDGTPYKPEEENAAPRLEDEFSLSDLEEEEKEESKE